MEHVIAYDIGTTGVKTCIFKIDETIELLASANHGYGLTILDNGGAEQDADEWWDAMCVTTHRVLEETGLEASKLGGISFCSQMQGLVLVDEDGNALRPPMSYMDQRATFEIKKGIAYGIQIAGANIAKLIPSLQITGAVSCSVKDPLWKYKWVEAHEPEVFSKVYKWLDVKEYLIMRCTGKAIMTPDSAYSTFLYDTRSGKEGWSEKLCKVFDVNMNHLPEIIGCDDVAGGLTEKAAADLGLAAGIPVFGGGGDATLIGIGSGCAKTGDTHIYCGTSGWVSTIVDKQSVDVVNMIAAIVGAEKGKFNYFAEMETAGKCTEWVKDHLALDEINVYLEQKKITDENVLYSSLYDYMTEVISKIPAGSGGVIFTPWLHGNRCPFEDPNAAGMFFNVKLETGKTELIRAVAEGVCFHLRWMLECQDAKINTSNTIRFCGGGALSDVTCQILSDMTGRKIEVVDHPQNVGAVGAASLMAVGLGVIGSLEEIGTLIPAKKSFEPQAENKAIYDKMFTVFKQLYKNNKKQFAALQEI